MKATTGQWVITAKGNGGCVYYHTKQGVPVPVEDEMITIYWTDQKDLATLYDSEADAKLGIKAINGSRGVKERLALPLNNMEAKKLA